MTYFTTHRPPNKATCDRRIAGAELIGWPALKESWERTRAQLPPAPPKRVKEKPHD